MFETSTIVRDMAKGEKRDSLMPVPDKYVIAQFDGINKALGGIQKAMRENSRAIGEIEGTQKAQADSLKRLERRLENVSRDTQVMYDGLRETTGQIEGQIHVLRPSQELEKERQKWIQKVFSETNVKVILWIILIVLAAILGFKIPTIEF